MTIDVSVGGARARAIELTRRIFEAAHPTLRRTRDPKADVLYREIRAYLLKASDERLIKESPVEVRRRLVISPPMTDGTSSIAVGSVRNFNRDPALPHFTRRDGGWFDFQLSVRSAGGTLEVLAYDFELRLASGAPIGFVRFDLNPEDGREGVTEGLRSHMHLGSDDDGYAVAAPVMSPYEILDMFLHGLAPTGRVRLQ